MTHRLSESPHPGLRKARLSAGTGPGWALCHPCAGARALRPSAPGQGGWGLERELTPGNSQLLCVLSTYHVLGNQQTLGTCLVVTACKTWKERQTLRVDWVGGRLPGSRKRTSSRTHCAGVVERQLGQASCRGKGGAEPRGEALGVFVADG